MKYNKAMFLNVISVVALIVNIILLIVHVLAFLSVSFLDFFYEFPLLKIISPFVRVGGSFFIFINIILLTISFWSILLIRKLERKGLWLYIVSQIGSLVSPYIFITFPVNLFEVILFMQIPNILISTFFIVSLLYLRSLLTN